MGKRFTALPLYEWISDRNGIEYGSYLRRRYQSLEINQWICEKDN